MPHIPISWKSGTGLILPWDDLILLASKNLKNK
jgi:hypothetical protein